MPFDLQGARAAGYTDTEIVRHLAADSSFDVAGARKAGYSDTEIIAHLASAPAPAPTVAPGMEGVPAPYGTPEPVAPKAPPTTVGQKLVGAGETALTMATGITGGTVGMIGGTIKGLAGAVMDGKFGTQEGVRQVEQAAAEGMQALTYAPRTESGQDQAAAVGNAMAATVPAMGLTAELSALGRGTAAAASVARDLTAAPIARARIAAPAIAERVHRTLSRNPDPATPTPGTRASGGSAGTDMANQRIALANDLPIPIEITEGMATRDGPQLKFEMEAAKGEHGAKFRERYSEINERMQKNFDAWVDQTGKTTADAMEVGKVTDKILRTELARDKAEVNVKYRAADKSPEALAEVDPGEVVSIGQGDNAIEHSVISYLNSKPSGLNTTALTDHAKQYALKLGVAAKAEDGSLIPLRSTVKSMEALRKEISQATGFEAIAKRDSAILKGIIDAQTEPVAGPLYRTARRSRELLARKWESRSVVADLVNNKRGMDDRKVAIADVFKHIVLDSDRSELSHMRRVLQTGGEEGKQAWRELQGQTVQWIKDEALKNVATDQRGNRIVSPAQLEKAIVKLDSKGKLDFIFGKKGAQQMRDINDLAKVVRTAPPEAAINTSNTASVLMAALAEAGVTGSMVGLPVPVISGMRLIAKQVRDRKLRARIEHALNAPQQRRNIPQDR